MLRSGSSAAIHGLSKEAVHISRWVALQLYLGGLCCRFRKRERKYWLLGVISGCSFFGTQGAILTSKIKDTWMPTVHAVIDGSQEWSFAVFLWSVVLLFCAACLVAKRMAFFAALELRERFKVVRVP